MLNVLFRVEMSMCLLLESVGIEREREIENVLSRVGWSVFLLAGGTKKWSREQCTAFLCCPGEVNWAEWHQSFSLDEIYKFETPMAKTIPTLNNYLKFFLSATVYIHTEVNYISTF